MMWKRFVLFFFYMGILGEAHAYIPPTEFLVSQITKRKQGFQNLTVTSVIQELSKSGPTQVQFKETTLIDFSSGRLFSHAYEVEGRDSFAIQKSLSRSSASGVPSFDDLNRPPFFDFLFFTADAPLVDLILFHHQLPILFGSALEKLSSEEDKRKAEKTFIRRWNQRIFWVITQNPVLQDAPPLSSELWIEKDSFLPMRFRTLIKGDVLEFWFENYRFVKDYAYPQEVTVQLRGQPLLKASLDKIEINRKIKPTDLKLRTATSSISSDIRRLIQTYYTFLR